MMRAKNMMRNVMKRTATGCHAVLMTYGPMEPVLPDKFEVLHIALPQELPINRALRVLQQEAENKLINKGTKRLAQLKQTKKERIMEIWNRVG